MLKKLSRAHLSCKEIRDQGAQLCEFSKRYNAKFPPVSYFFSTSNNYLLIFYIVDVRWEIRSGFKTQERLATQNEELENLYYQLLTEEFFLNSPARIEKKAKEDLGMVKVRPKKIK